MNFYFDSNDYDKAKNICLEKMNTITTAVK